MQKRIVGGAILAAATLLTFHPRQNMTGETKPVISIQQEDFHSQDFIGEGKMQNDDLVLPNDQVPITLVETIDGDTIKAKINRKIETVRYLLIDTPESKKPGMCVQPYAKEAFKRNNQLLRNGSLTMGFEQGNRKDAYGRLLAYVYVDGSSVQETLLKEGFARVAYIIDPPYKLLPQYRVDENFAKRNKVNIWSRMGYVTSRGFLGCVP
jgi:micrococcal nuclease